MKSLDKIAIVTLLAAFLGQSVSFETGIKDEILKANGKPMEEHFLSESRILEDRILEMVISAIKNGSDCLGNPPLDPFEYEENIHFENIEVPDYVLLDYINVDGIHSTKLSEFLVNSFTFSLADLKVVFNFTFPELNLRIDHYSFSAVVMNIIPLLGDGEVTLTVQDVVLAASFSIGASESDSIFLDELQLQLAVGIVKFAVTGLMGGSRTSYLAGEMASEIGPQVIEELQASYGPEIAQELQNFINSFVSESELTLLKLMQCLLY
ncbi:hypothetical protein L798_09552 [Zootermopsis nevadensis]|uniref:Uncharacterized protein n=1 Tax=Zootermopsis nevadensis TaxID=136037 RepID=A0A067R1I9_ZOONE|nr:hypothetical protein L798_09552 [Zootermopsis nevadensis]